MILKIKGNVNRYYVQTLCMIFFPGATFGENEQPDWGVPEVDVIVAEDDKCAIATVSIKLYDKIAVVTESVDFEKTVTLSTHAAIAVGKAMLAAGKELIGYTPPWGMLTGVRPAKIATSLMQSGNGIIKTKRILRDEYFLNPQKAALCVSVAAQENKVLKRTSKNGCSIYISIPFCPSRCSYCSFVSYTTKKLLSLIDEYIDALLCDIDEIFDTIETAGLNLSTIYIGGGTPTTLSAKQLDVLLSKISSRTDTSRLLEFTLEAGRPDTITEEKLAIAKKYGVTRISVNPQTLNDNILTEIGRKHTVEDFYRAYAIAQKSGIKDINVDLIAGLPGDDFKNFSETLDKIIELNPTNITVHTFSVKKAADVLRKNSKIYSLSGGDAAKCVAYSQLKTKFAGYKPYYMYRQKNTVGNLENVGFSKDGSEGLYNVFMMEETETIFAAGAGAVTKLVKPNKDTGKNDIVRIFSPKYPYEYLSKKNKENSTAEPGIKEKTIDFFNLQQ